MKTYLFEDNLSNFIPWVKKRGTEGEGIGRILGMSIRWRMYELNREKNWNVSDRGPNNEEDPFNGDGIEVACF